MKRNLLLGLAVLLVTVLISRQNSWAQGPSAATQAADATPTLLLPPPPPGTLLPPPSGVVTATPTNTAPITQPPTIRPLLSPTPTPTSLKLAAPVVNVLTDTDNYRCDATQCSLRAAVYNAAPGATITFAPGLTGMILLPPSPIDSRSPRIDIQRDLTIKGPGAKIVSIGGDIHRSFQGIVVASSATLRVSGLTFTQALDVIINMGTLIISDCVFGSNENGITNSGIANVTTSTFLANGRAIATGRTSATMTITDSTFQSNGPDAVTNVDGMLTIVNSTFQGNVGAVANAGRASIVNSTFQNNHSDPFVSISAGGHNTTLKNTIVADKAGKQSCDGGIIDGGNNLQFPNNDCGSSIPVGDPKLGLLQDNGGLTWTMALLPGSAALDAGNEQACIDTLSNLADQRGMALPDSNSCDIGAFQHRAKPSIPVSNPTTTAITAQ